MAPLRPCRVCRQPARDGYCQAHPRPTTAGRGYGADHRRDRRSWAPAVAAGTVRCARCGELIVPGEAWDLDHTDDRGGYLGPSHARCNRATAGRPW